MWNNDTECLPGTAVYLFGLLPPSSAVNSSIPSSAFLTFAIDNKTLAGLLPDGASPISSNTNPQINVPFFKAENLAQGDHSLTVTLGDNTIFVFDYLVVTTDSTITGNGTSVGGGMVNGNLSGAALYVLCHLISV
jgi:hypothetical protein